MFMPSVIVANAAVSIIIINAIIIITITLIIIIITITLIIIAITNIFTLTRSVRNIPQLQDVV